MGILGTLISGAVAKGVIKAAGHAAVNTAVGVACVVSAAKGQNSDEPAVIKAHKVKAPEKAPLINTHYLCARAALVAAGFTDISFIARACTFTGWFRKDGDVLEISIGGKTDFSANTKFDANTPVVIEYFSVGNTQPGFFNTGAPLQQPSSYQSYEGYIDEVQITDTPSAIVSSNPVESNVFREEETHAGLIQFCTMCGAKQSADGRFCSRCGHRMQP